MQFAPAPIWVLCLCSAAHAQWSPAVGQWGRTDSRDVRIMTWNVQDGICSTNPKLEGNNDWTAIARIIAAMKPDVLLLQECGDNSGNGTGAGVDSISTLSNVTRLLIDGGTDPTRGGAVTAYIRKYDPSLSYPYVWVGSQNDGFNRNIVVSKYPFTDLNGDTKATYDSFANVADLYAPGGGPGIRGWIVAEINLPDASYRGNLVTGCSHLRSGGAASDLAERLAAGQNIAYFIDHFYNGGGTLTPDPRNKIADFPQATQILDPWTPMIWGGDLNEDENTNGRDGPAAWFTRAANGSLDGTDRDRSDSTFDDARDPLSTNASNRNTQGSGKLDYLCYQDSIVTLRRSYIYSSVSGAPNSYPPELIGYSGTPALASVTASDHKPVIADFIFAAPPVPPGPFTLIGPGNNSINQPLSPALAWSVSAAATSYSITLDDAADFVSPLWTRAGVTANAVSVPANLLSPCGTYFWRVTAANADGQTLASNAPFRFTTVIPADFNADGFLDGFDYDEYVSCFEGDACPPGATADFNADGFLDGFDYDDFVTAFEQGCN